MIVDRVAAVHMLPVGSGEKFVLRVDRTTGEAQREALVQPLYLLQENEIGVERAQAVAQLVDHEPTVELRQPFVDVERDDAQAVLFHRSSSKRRSITSASSKCRPGAVGCFPHCRILVPGISPSRLKIAACRPPARGSERSSS